MARLLELGADPHIQDEFGATAKTTAEVGAAHHPERKAISAKIAKLLWKAG